MPGITHKHLFKKNSKTGRTNVRIAWDHKIYITRAKIRGATPLGYNRNTPMPPDPMTGFSPVANGNPHRSPLYGVYLDRGYQLTEPYPTCDRDMWQHESSMGVTGTRLDVRSDSGGLSFPVVISTVKFLGSTQQGHNLACPDMPLLIILVTTRILVSLSLHLWPIPFCSLVQINIGICDMRK